MQNKSGAFQVAKTAKSPRIIAMRVIFVCLLIGASFINAVPAEDTVPILDMNADHVARLLARNQVSLGVSPSDDTIDGTALVDFIRWYESMPPMARYIEASNPDACKAWASVARLMQREQQIAAASPSAFLEWHSHNLRIADMWMLPLTFHSPSALLWAAFGNVSSAPAAFAPIRNMGTLDTLVKWIIVPSYPLLVVSVNILPQSKFFWVLVAHFGVCFVNELLFITQLLLAYLSGNKSALHNLWDQCVGHFHARLPRAAITFALAFGGFYCLWPVLPLSLIRLPMYSLVICHVVDILHTAYFVAAELHALVKMSRKGPEFDEEMRVRPLNPAILSGATDIIAVRHKDGTLRHSAFHVRFGWRSGVFRGGNVVDVLIDGKKTNKTMKIGSSGVAYFPDESDEDKIIRDLDAAKEVFTIKFLPKITLWGKDVTKVISKFLKVEIQTQLHVWDHTDKVIISDIDGTITRSDGAGHLLFWARKWKLPILSSKNFTHAHVVDLLAAVSQRKYRIMYLTARNIGYASQTKAYIRGIFSENNEDKRLPPGPVITSHSGLVSALWLEIFLKRPDEFKIEELRVIQSLFAPAEGLSLSKVDGPFYAGLGNRPTDTKSYVQVGVREDKIFIVNVRGQVKVGPALKVEVLESYKSVIDNIELHFPLLKITPQQSRC